MDQAGDQSLARSIVAEYENRTIVLGGLCDLFLDRLHPW